jgi:hypothetical protein
MQSSVQVNQSAPFATIRFLSVGPVKLHTIELETAVARCEVARYRYDMIPALPRAASLNELMRRQPTAVVPSCLNFENKHMVS